MKHLSSLSVLNYVYGGLVCFSGLFMLSIVFLGHFLGSDWLANQGEEPPPPFLGVFFIALGWALFALVEFIGILSIISGRMIAQRRNRTFSLVIAAFQCLSFPFGTALGIFTFVTLGDEEVQRSYAMLPA